MASNPLSLVYNLRHISRRRTQSLFTIVGIALVVFVFVATLMLEEGLRFTLASTGSLENAIVLRVGAENEIQSGVNREAASVIEMDPSVATDADGNRLLTKDVVVLISMKKRVDGQPSNVNVRGVLPAARMLRDGITIIEGRLPTPGTREVMLGRAIHTRFLNTDIGSQIRMVGTEWTVTGIFDPGMSAFGSEIWGDVDILLPAFRRDRFSSVTYRLNGSEPFDVIKERLESDKRLSVTVIREQEFYARQSRVLGLFIRYVGIFVSVVFSLGAMIGAMITMYSAVANRTREIGILRALGFARNVVFRAFLRECVVLSLIGGVGGLVLASLLVFAHISTTNFQTFSELGFGFRITPRIAISGMIFALIMGTLGGALPALRGARLRILTALKD
ncbi:MAG: ABC transporter permease [Deltaproteobacteria bacterium]|nr:ABC transporter permease [Deltaproteobacteria bacterium]